MGKINKNFVLNMVFASWAFGYWQGSFAAGIAAMWFQIMTIEILTEGWRPRP